MKPQYSIKELTDKFFPIYFYRKHLDIAAKDILGLDLSPHHRLILRDWSCGKPINLLFSSRGMGKSVLGAIFILLMSILYPRLKTVVVAGTGLRGAKSVLLEVERIILGHLSGQEQLRYARYSLINYAKIINKDPSYWTINFMNGSVIYGIPLGMTSYGGVIRGLRAHLLFEDESFLIPTRLHQASLEPMQNVLYAPNKPIEEQPVKNSTFFVSTCDQSGRDFYQQYLYYRAVLEGKKEAKTANEIKEGIKINKDDISLFNFDMDDSYYIHKKKRLMKWGLDYARIMKKKMLPTTDTSVWLAENKNQVYDLQGDYYTFDDLEKCMNIVLDIEQELFPEALDSCSSPCILGVDTAPSGDNTAFVVIKASMLESGYDCEKCAAANMGQKCPFLNKNKKCLLKQRSAVIYAYEENKMDQKDRVKLIYELMSRYNIIAISMDARGGGMELADLLRDPDYVTNVTGRIVKPMYDPNRDPNGKGMPILTLYSSTQEMNLAFNGYTKGLINNQNLLFPKPLFDRPKNPRILEIAGHIETLVHQLARIKAYPKGNSITFKIEGVDAKSGKKIELKKDLYSALILATGHMRNLILQKEEEDLFDIDNLPLPVEFNM